MENTNSAELYYELNAKTLAILETVPSTARSGSISPLHNIRMKWLQEFIKNDDTEHLDYKHPILRKSDVWKCGFYNVVYYKHIRQNFIICRICNNLITHKSTLGVNKLLKHPCYRSHILKADTNKIQELLDTKSKSISFEMPAILKTQQAEHFKYYCSLKLYNEAIDYLYCILCKKAIEIKKHDNFVTTISQHELLCIKKKKLTPHSQDSENRNGIKDILLLLISISDPSINFVYIKKSDDKNSVWYYDLFRVIERNGQRQDFLYCKNCKQLVPYQVTEYPHDVLNHKCLRDMSDNSAAAAQSSSTLQLTDNNRTEIVIDEQDSIFEIRILDEDYNENVDGGISDLNVVNNYSLNIDDNVESTVIPIPIPPLLIQSLSPPPPPLSQLSSITSLDNQLIELEHQGHCKRTSALPPPLQPLSVKPTEKTYGNKNNKKMKLDDNNQDLELTSSKITKTQTNENIEEEKLKLTMKFLSFLQKISLPMEISDESLHRLLQCLLNAGATFGVFNLKNYWLNKKKVDFNLLNHYSNLRQQLKKIVKQEKLSFSCDTWEDLVDKTIYLTLRAHFIDDEFCLESIVLGTKLINLRNRLNSSDWFVKSIIDILQEYTIIQVSLTQRRIASILLRDSNGFVLTQQQEKQYQSPPSKKMLICSATILNDIINKVFSKNNELQEFTIKMYNSLSEIFTTNYLSTTKDLIKKRQLRNNFELIKWDTILSLLILYKNNAKQIKQDEQMQQNVTALFKLFKVLKSGLQCLGNIETTVPTINIVCIVKQKLLSDLRSLGGECTIFELLRTNLRTSIDNEFIINELHKIAAFLDPRFKALRFLSTTDRVNVQEIVKNLICDPSKAISHDNLSFAKNNKQIDLQLNDDDDIASDAYLMEYMDESLTVDTVESEMNIYINMTVNNNEKLSVLDFWRNHKELPKLRELVRKILSIPASSNLEACKFSPKALGLIQKRCVQRDHMDKDLEIAHVINGNLHVISFEDSSLTKEKQ